MAAAILIGVIGVKEFFNGWENMGVHPSANIAYVMTGLLYVIHILSICNDKIGEYQPFLIMMWLAMAVSVSFIYGWKINERGAYDAIATASGLIYVVFFSYHIVLIDSAFGSAFKPMVWIVLLASFGSDICAYFTGYLIGKHKLAPVLSPKKTIEGAVGGVIGGALLCVLAYVLFLRNQMPLVNGWIVAVIGAFAAAVSQAGDLTASAFKRKMGIKDYGNLIPGHGGIMDRFDSVIFTAPFVFYATMLFMVINGGL